MTTVSSAGALWHPFADMGAITDSRLTLSKASGIHVYDKEGREYIDASASLWYVNLGHGRPEIRQAMLRQYDLLDSYSIFGDYSNTPAVELAEKLALLSTMPDCKVFLGSGGGDMIETAAKVARAYFELRGEPRRHHLISRSHGYHGTHGFGTSIAGISANAAGWGKLLPNVSQVAHDSPEALEAEIRRLGAERVAAFFCEPVIGSGGVLAPPEGYIERVAEVCREHEVLFVADSVISGFGRLGTWFGIDRWSVVPDMVVLAKGITNGAFPLGALMVSGHVAEPWFKARPETPVLRHGQTYAGHPVGCAAALAAIGVYESEGLIERGRTLERPLAAALERLTDHPLVAEVRAGTGLMAGIEFDIEAVEAIINPSLKLQLSCRHVGVLVRPLAAGMAISPPLTVTEDELGLISDRLWQGLELLGKTGMKGSR